MTTTDPLALFFAPEPPPDPKEVLRQDLLTMIKDRDKATPRHLQVELGPSEVGHPCLRKLAYGLLAVPRANPYYDPLPSIIGTAVHTWLESAAAHANKTLGRQRWITEMKVNVAPGLSGSCDLYDVDTRTVIDWKVPGKNRFDMYRKDMSPVFKAQVHMYGLGFERAGYPVKRVAVCLVPRGNGLNLTHLWMEDYDPAIAHAAVQRREQVLSLLSDWDVEHNPDRLEWFAKTEYDCVFCGQWRPNPVGPMQCDGIAT